MLTHEEAEVIRRTAMLTRELAMVITAAAPMLEAASNVTDRLARLATLAADEPIEPIADPAEQGGIGFDRGE